MRQRDDLVFPMAEFERRLAELRGRMAARAVDALVVTTPENICYLTGFESPGHFRFNALVVPLEGEPFMTPRLLEDSGVEALTWVEIRHPYTDIEDPIAKLYTTLHTYGLHDKRIGIERGCWFFTALQQDQFAALASDATLIDCTMMVEAGRLIKSEAEIALMRRAAEITDLAMQAGVEATRVGVTENDIAIAMHTAMIAAGGEWPAISPFVASGYRGAIGHATWAGRTIEANDVVMIEAGGCLRRYHAASMRTLFIGEPSKAARTAEKVVQEAFDAMMRVIRPGVPAAEADATARKIIAAAGSTQASRSAYSIGIALSPDWGEGHIFSMQPNEPRPLQENMTFHLLPWVQVPGEGGISISETIRVTAGGCERLTHLDRHIFVR